MLKEFLIYRDNDLVFLSDTSSFPLTSLVKNYQGPVFFYNLDFIRMRVKQMQRALKGVKLFYALKANTNPDVLSIFKAEGVGVDVVSGGEIDHAIKCGFSFDSLVYSGVGKTKTELEIAIRKGIYQINVESIPELQRICEIAKKIGKRANVAFRVNPDISIQSHPYIATGLKDNKFGIDTSQFSDVIRISQSHAKYLSVKGISLHLGSQMMEFSSLRESLAKLKPLFLELRSAFPECHCFDFGGGLGIVYDQQNLEWEGRLLTEYSQAVFSEMDTLKSQVPDLELQSEPGRWLVGHAGVLLAQVQYVKTTPHKEFLILDSGMNHLIRPSLYEAFHGIHKLSITSSLSEKNYDVVGPICESADFLGKNRILPEMKPDDFVVIRDCGAYAASMSSDYNLQKRALEMSSASRI